MENNDITLPKHWKQYLFYPQRWDASEMALQRQQDFIRGATMFPALKRTLDGSLGVVFRKPTKIELVPQLSYLEDNADGTGKGLEQLIQDVTSENILQGYGGMLTDFAASDELNSKAEDEALNKFAAIHIYTAESIRNVYTRRVGSAMIVQQIILEETHQDRINQFDVKEKTQYRVLLLDENGLYRQEIYRQNNTSADNTLVAVFEPRNSAGSRLDYIPFSFFGSKCNDFRVDSSPLYGLARMNAKHLEYSAMRNESIRQLAPTLFAFPGENFDYDDFEENNPQGITMGGYNAYLLGAGGSASIIQASPNDAAFAAMNHLEALMVQAGALLITPNPSNVSTETTIIQRSTDTSVLGMAVRNVEDAINQQLAWAADFMGAAAGSTVDINREFFSMPMNAQDRAQWSADVMTGAVTIEEYREALNKAGLLPDSSLEEDITFQPIVQEVPQQEDVDEDGN